MIYDFQKVNVITFTDGKDDYGQRRKVVDTNATREVEMMIRNYQQVNVTDVRFIDATDIGLTFDAAITDANQIISTSGTYNVLYVIPSRRLYQIFLKRVG